MSTTEEMTGRERVTCAMEHRDHDRVPRYDAFWDETIDRFRKEGMLSAPEDLFNFDVDKLNQYTPVPFPGRHEVIRRDVDTTDFVNGYGAMHRRWNRRSGVPEHLGNECCDPNVWRARFKHRILAAHLDLEALRERYQKAHEAGRWVCFGTRGVFSFVQTLVGDETLLIAMAEEPEWVIDMADTVSTTYIAGVDAALDAGMELDGIFMADDQAYRNGPFMSPAMYRHQIKPFHTRMAEFAHERNLKFVLHTDGDIRQLIPDIIETGADTIQPLEAKAGLDVRKLATTIGHKVALWGNIDMTVALMNDRDALEYEIVSKLKAVMPTRGYLYHSDHSVPPQVSWSTYLFIHELLDRHGRYA